MKSKKKERSGDNFMLGFSEMTNKRIKVVIRIFPCTAKEICDILGYSYSLVTSHLNHLFSQGEIERTKVGTYYYYIH